MAQKAICPIDSLTEKMDPIAKTPEIQKTCFSRYPAWFVQDFSDVSCKGSRVILCADKGSTPVQTRRSLKIFTKDATSGP